MIGVSMRVTPIGMSNRAAAQVAGISEKTLYKLDRVWREGRERSIF